MADSSGKSDDILIQSLKENALSKNTLQSTNNWISLRLLKRVLTKALKSMNRRPWTKSSSSFTQQSVRRTAAITNLIALVWWLLLSTDTSQRKNTNIPSFVTEFKSSKQVLEGKARQLRQQGKCKRPNKARSLTSTEENEQWEKKKLGKESPQILVETVWWLLTQYFGLRGRQEHHSMMVEDFSFGLDENNAEYVEFIESPTKTRQSGLSAKPRSFLPKNFYWRWKMSRYNLHQRVSVAPSSRNTYNRSTLFVLCVKPFLASLVQATTDGSEQAQWHGEDRNQTGTTLQDSWKTFSNHSARKTVVKKLKTTGLERGSIVKVAGFRNEKSLDDYDEGDEHWLWVVTAFPHHQKWHKHQ